MFYEFGGITFSHAGFNFDPHSSEPEILINEWPWTIGRARNGSSPYGGPLWLDWNHEFEGFPNEEGLWSPQIVGHTQGVGVRMKKGSINLDCGLKYCALVNYQGGIEIVSA